MNEEAEEIYAGCYPFKGELRHFEFDEDEYFSGTDDDIEFDILCCESCLKKDKLSREDFYQCRASGGCSKYYCDHFYILTYKNYDICIKCILKGGGGGECKIANEWLRTLNNSKNEQISVLEAEIELLKTQIKYQPDGEGFVEAKEHFEELAKK